MLTCYKREHFNPFPSTEKNGDTPEACFTLARPSAPTHTLSIAGARFDTFASEPLADQRQATHAHVHVHIRMQCGLCSWSVTTQLERYDVRVT